MTRQSHWGVRLLTGPQYHTKTIKAKGSQRCPRFHSWIPCQVRLLPCCLAYVPTNLINHLEENPHSRSTMQGSSSQVAILIQCEVDEFCQLQLTTSFLHIPRWTTAAEDFFSQFTLHHTGDLSSEVAALRLAIHHASEEGNQVMPHFTGLLGDRGLRGPHLLHSLQLVHTNADSHLLR